MRVNRWLDLLDRAGWTAIQAAAGAVIAALTVDDVTWEAGLTMVAAATLVAVCKVIVAQRTGTGDDGSAVPGQVLDPPPAKL